MREWLSALVRRRPARAAGDQTRAVELGDGMAVVFVRAQGAVTERYRGIRGTPSRVVRDMAAERLTRGQLEAGEEPWLPDVAARLGVPPRGAAAAGHDDAAPA